MIFRFAKASVLETVKASTDRKVNRGGVYTNTQHTHTYMEAANGQQAFEHLSYLLGPIPSHTRTHAAPHK